MARKTKKEALETRARILDAAIDVFYEKGIAKSSLEEIAEIAGVTRGAVYWHFKNKVDIFSALLDQKHIAIIENLQSEAEDSSKNSLEQLQEFYIGFLKAIKKGDQNYKILSLLMIKCDYTGDLALFKEHQLKKQQESIEVNASFFTEAIKARQLSGDYDPKFLALSLYCYICGIFVEYLRQSDFFDLNKQARPLVEQFFKNLK